MQKEENKRQRSRSSWVVVLFMLVFIPAVGFHVWNQSRVLKDLKAEEATLQEQLAEEQARSIELEKQQEYYTSDSYIEKVAREQLGLVKPDEVVFKNQE